VAGSCVYDNKPSCSVNVGDFFNISAIVRLSLALTQSVSRSIVLKM
jgi:hypothetical protein